MGIKYNTGPRQSVGGGSVGVGGYINTTPSHSFTTYNRRLVPLTAENKKFLQSLGFKCYN